MTVPSSLTELQLLVNAGKLKFVYILGPPRANTTVLCRLLGRRLHGSVYEPAFPNTAFPTAAYGRKILGAYHAVRRRLPDGEPVALAIKDLSALMSGPERDFALDNAARVVFAIREPVLQHSSLVRQLLTEFSSGKHLPAFVKRPWETLMFGWHFGLRWPRYHRLAKQRLGIGWSQYQRMTAAGSNLDSWQVLAEHFAEARRRLPADRIAVIDAGLCRLMPAEAEAELDAIVAPIVPRVEPGAPPLDVAVHSMMNTRSPWVGEALTSQSFKAFRAPAKVKSPIGDFDEWLPEMAGALYPYYTEMFYHPAHRLRRRFIDRPIPVPDEAEPYLGHLLAARDAEDAIARARALGRIAF
ncbi:MAG TPA: hypothetical protein VMW31_01045 [Devosiaceae bacterium]|nr:hypothetical protein [Devosiaceae bacterium]